MSFQGITPEQIIAGKVSDNQTNGAQMRTETISALLANIELLEIEFASEEDRHSALLAIERLAPAAIALGLNKHVVWKNPKVRAMIDKVINSGLKSGKTNYQFKEVYY